MYTRKPYLEKLRRVLLIFLHSKQFPSSLVPGEFGVILLLRWDVIVICDAPPFRFSRFYDSLLLRNIGVGGLRERFAICTNWCPPQRWGERLTMFIKSQCVEGMLDVCK